MLVTFTHSLGGEDTVCQGLMGVLKSRVNQQGLWEAGFVVTRGRNDPWEDVIGFSE